MTDEELQQTMQEISESLEKLSDPDQPLTKEESKRQRILLLKKELLQRIKEARAGKNVNQEMAHTITYGLLTSLGEKHPFLMYLLQGKFRWNVF